MKKLPLENTQTKTIPTGSRLKKELGKTEEQRRSDPAKVADHLLEQPNAFSMCKLKKKIEEVKNENPDLSGMVEEKLLSSPATAKYIRKKKASKATIVESQKVFQDLVSLDMSGTNLVKNIEENMRRRACAVQPPPRSPDPEPRLEDYFREEEFVSVRTVGPSDIFPLPPPREPCGARGKPLRRYIDSLLM